MSYTQITAVWTGAAGLPGYTRLRFNGPATSAEAEAMAARVRTFFAAWTTYIPSGIRISFGGPAQIFSDAAVLEGEVTYTSPADVNGTAAGAYAAASGATVQWLTNAYQNGRKVRGRTFMVPLAAAYDTAGTLATAVVTNGTAAANALANDVPGLTLVTRSGAIVQRASIVGGVVADRAAVLRSRRD